MNASLSAREKELLQELPPSVQEGLLAAVVTQEKGDFEAAYVQADAAMKALEYRDGMLVDPVPVPEEAVALFTSSGPILARECVRPRARRFAEEFCLHRQLDRDETARPGRRRAFGIDPPGILQRPVPWVFVTKEGAPFVTEEVPFSAALQWLGWGSAANRALYSEPGDPPEPNGETQQLRAVGRLPFAEQMRLFSEVAESGILPYLGTNFGHTEQAHFAKLVPSAEEAEALLPEVISTLDRWASHTRGQPRFFAFLAFRVLARANHPLEARWDARIPLYYSSPFVEETLAILARLPAERRNALLLAELTKPLLFPSYRVELGLAVTRVYPELPLLEATLQARLDDRGIHKHTLASVIKQLKAAAGTDKALLAQLKAMVPTVPKPIKLICTSSVRPIAVSELHGLQAEQLLHAAKRFDGLELPLAVRVEKIPAGDPLEEHSFFQTIDFRTFAKEDGTPLYDAVLFDYEGGAIFKTGTLEVIAEIGQGGVDCADKVLEAALGPLTQNKPKISKPKAPKTK